MKILTRRARRDVVAILPGPDGEPRPVENSAVSTGASGLHPRDSAAHLAWLRWAYEEYHKRRPDTEIALDN